MSEKQAEVLLVERDEPVWIVRLNRPDALNSFDSELHVRFGALWAEVEQSESVRAVVLTGNGRAFSAGGNLDDFELFRVNFAERRKAMRTARRLVDEMLNVHVPVVAAVNGPAVGLGATLMTLCDIVFMSDSTFVADPHVASVVVAGDGGGVTWPVYTSLLKVKQYLLTGDRIPAHTAVEMGLANFAVPADEVLPKAIEFAERLVDAAAGRAGHKALLNQILRSNAGHSRSAWASLPRVNRMTPWSTPSSPPRSRPTRVDHGLVVKAGEEVVPDGVEGSVRVADSMGEPVQSRARHGRGAVDATTFEVYGLGGLDGRMGGRDATSADRTD